ELSSEARPVKGLTIAGWVAYNNAVLTEPFPPPEYGVAGDRLPYSSRFSGSLSVQQEFPVTSKLTGFVGGAASYVGQRLNDFTETAQRPTLPGYTQVDFHTGVRRDSWAVNVYVNNVADKRGILGLAFVGSSIPSFIYTTPRMVGLTVTKTF